MKKLLFLAMALLFLAPWAHAQHTTVTAQVLDPTGNTYRSCTGSANFIGQNTTPGAPPYTLNGGAFQTVVPIACDSFARFTVSLADNNVVTPSPSQWNFSLCSATGAYPGPPICFNALITITGTSQNVTTPLQAAAAPLPSSYVLPALTINTLGGVKGTGSSLTCTVGSMVTGFASDGTMQCATVNSNLSALTSVALGGVKGTGTSTACGVNQAVTGYAADGTMQCATITSLPSATAAGQTIVSTGVGTTYIAQSKVMQDVRDCGVVGDAVTDDSAALQSCIINNSQVSIPYNMTNCIRITKTLNLVGMYGIDFPSNGRFGPNNAGIDPCILFDPPQPAITSASRTSNVITYLTASAHSLVVNENVSVSGATDSTYNCLSCYVQSVPDSTHFTLNVTGSNGSTTGGQLTGGTAILMNGVRDSKIGPLYIKLNSKGNTGLETMLVGSPGQITTNDLIDGVSVRFANTANGAVDVATIRGGAGNVNQENMRWHNIYVYCQESAATAQNQGIGFDFVGPNPNARTLFIDGRNGFNNCGEGIHIGGGVSIKIDGVLDEQNWSDIVLDSGNEVEITRVVSELAHRPYIINGTSGGRVYIHDGATTDLSCDSTPTNNGCGPFFTLPNNNTGSSGQGFIEIGAMNLSSANGPTYAIFNSDVNFVGSVQIDQGMVRQGSVYENLTGHVTGSFTDYNTTFARPGYVTTASIIPAGGAGTVSASLGVGAQNAGTLGNGGSDLFGFAALKANLGSATALGEMFLSHPTENSTNAGGLSIPIPFYGDIDLKGVSLPLIDSVTTAGTAGAASDTYVIVSRTSMGGYASLGVTVSTANATLSTTNYNQIQWRPRPGVGSDGVGSVTGVWDIYRTSNSQGGLTTGKIGTMWANCNVIYSDQCPSFIGTPTFYTFNDTGLTGDGTTPPTTGSRGSIRYTNQLISTLAGSSGLPPITTASTVTSPNLTANSAMSMNGNGSLGQSWGMTTNTRQQGWLPGGFSGSSGNITIVSQGEAICQPPTGTCSSAVVNTQGATLLVLVTAGYNSNTPDTFTESLGNTWVALPTYTSAGNVKIYYAYAKGGSALATGPDVITGTNNNSAYTIWDLFALSGTLTTSAVFDVSTGHNGPQTPPFAAGPLTTTAAGDFVITGISIQAPTGNISIDSNYVFNAGLGFGLSENAQLLAQPAAGVTNPTWSIGGYSTCCAVTMAAFKAASYTAPGVMLSTAAPAGHYLRGNGSNYLDNTIQQSDLPATSSQTIATGTATLGTSAIASGACATVVTVTATGVLTTDVISWTPNADISAATGYTAGGGLAIYVYPTANTMNFKVCNGSASSVTPGAVTLNARVAR